MLHKFLCQNCLHVVESEDWNKYHIEEGSCPVCGGDMCGCPDCLAHINSCQQCEHHECFDCPNINPINE